MSHEIAPKDRQTAEDLAALYRRMSLIRHTELALLDLFSRNELFGTTHTSIGQEANAVGVIAALDLERDAIWSNHRCHGHFLAYSGNVAGLIAEVMGRESGVCGGRGGSQHLCHKRFYSNGVQGGIVPLAVGTAHALRSEGAITVVFLGDGTMGQGVVYEGLNLAALWKIPVLFVVEDNGIAQTTVRAESVAGSIARRAEPFGIECFSYQGTDVRQVRDIARQAVAHVRSTQQPAWLHLETVRLGPHSKGDDTRDPALLQSLWKQDPLGILQAEVPDWEIHDAAVSGLVEEAIQEARKSRVACAS